MATRAARSGASLSSAASTSGWVSQCIRHVRQIGEQGCDEPGPFGIYLGADQPAGEADRALDQRRQTSSRDEGVVRGRSLR